MFIYKNVPFIQYNPSLKLCVQTDYIQKQFAYVTETMDKQRIDHIVCTSEVLLSELIHESNPQRFD